jgi:aspartyl-tRNA(Asn)/glutamyl-tRNA(Gln) amidotransferase subunit B
MDQLLDYSEAVRKFDITFGIEVHVELNTKTKMFCSAPVSFAAPPNSQTTPVSLGLPGSLPVLNKTALEYAIKIGLALNCSVAKVSRFARKNYFYPDLVKNYQISQSDEPIVYNGFLNVPLDDGSVFKVEIERAHMEEDAGKSNHIGKTGRIQGAHYSLIDYNRSGVPLVEIVTFPNLVTNAKAPEIIASYVRGLRDIFKVLNVSDAKMEKGNVRADINISLAPKNSQKLGIRTETKNVNSLKSIISCSTYEICRQAYILDKGGEVLQETRHWHEDSLTTSSGRIKSDADDYRYFPEPDLVPVVTNSQQIDKIRQTMPELPFDKRQRLAKAWQFDVKTMSEIVNAGALDLIEQAVKLGVSPQGAKKWYMGELLRWAKAKSCELDSLLPTAQDIVYMEKLIKNGKINDKIARTVLQKVLQGQGDFATVLDKENLHVVEDLSVLEQAVDTALANNLDILQKLKSGNMAPIGVIIGQVMKVTKGQADAKKVTDIIKSRL